MSEALMFNTWRSGSRAFVGEEASPWFARPLRRDSEVRLFCFPYAGGTSHTYRSWQKGLPQTIEVCPVELPGRNSRIGESPVRSVKRLIEEMTPALLPYLDRPFAFFGHSMGGLISFELTRELRRSYALYPERLFISACPAPHRRGIRQRVSYDLPEAEFVKELKRLGTPPEILDHSELRNIFLPIFRADFEACQTHRHSEEPPLDRPLTIFGGLQDKDLDRDELEEWRMHTTSVCVVRMLEGGHLFVNASQPLILGSLAEELQGRAPSRSLFP